MQNTSQTLLQNPPVALAPLAGITDLPFRNLVSSFGASFVVSEMVASQEMVQAKKGVREKAELGFESAIRPFSSLGVIRIGWQKLHKWWRTMARK